MVRTNPQKSNPVLEETNIALLAGASCLMILAILALAYPLSEINGSINVECAPIPRLNPLPVVALPYFTGLLFAALANRKPWRWEVVTCGVITLLPFLIWLCSPYVLTSLHTCIRHEIVGFENKKFAYNLLDLLDQFFQSAVFVTPLLTYLFSLWVFIRTRRPEILYSSLCILVSMCLLTWGSAQRVLC